MLVLLNLVMIDCYEKSYFSLYFPDRIPYVCPARLSIWCGWIINIDDKEYHPINLDALYKVDGLEIDIRYHILSSEWECPQWKPRKFKQIEIISISLNN